MAYLLRVNGMVQEVKPANGELFELDELQKMVGGYIEIVRTHTGDWMVLNEEGKNMGLPKNEQATERYRFGAHDEIVGDVLIAKYEELEPEDED